MTDTNHGSSPALQQQNTAEFQDCTPCRAIGSVTFLGLGAFTYISGHAQLSAQEEVIRKSKSMFGMASRRAGITTTAGVMAGLGLYRWFA